MNEITSGFGPCAVSSSGGRSPVKAMVVVKGGATGAECAFTSFNLDLKERGGEFLFGIRSGDGAFRKFPLQKSAQNFPIAGADAMGDCDCVLAHVEDGVVVPVLWGSTGGRFRLTGNMTDGFISRAAEREAAFSPGKDGQTAGGDGGAAAADVLPAAGVESEPATFPAVEAGDAAAAEIAAAAAARSEYSDYAVAAENYYPADYSPAFIRPAAPPAAAFPAEAQTVYAAPAETAAPPEIPLRPSVSDGIKEVSAPPAGDAASGGRGGTFYRVIKSQLDELFGNYPKEEFLRSLFRDTDWVKVNYDDSGLYYTVGLIYDGDTVRYICYGVPGRYSAEPPRELKGFCQWLPLDSERSEGEGYWMMYQDADSGDSVKVEMI